MSPYTGPGLLAPQPTGVLNQVVAAPSFTPTFNPSASDLGPRLVDLPTAPVVSLGGVERRVAFLDNNTNAALSSRQFVVADLSGRPTGDAINDFEAFNGQVVQRFTSRAATTQITRLPTIAAEPSTEDLAFEIIGGKLVNVGVRLAAPAVRYVAGAGFDVAGRALNTGRQAFHSTVIATRQAGQKLVDTARRVRGDVDFSPLRRVQLNSGAAANQIPRGSAGVTPTTNAVRQRVLANIAESQAARQSSNFATHRAIEAVFGNANAAVRAARSSGLTNIYGRFGTRAHQIFAELSQASNELLRKNGVEIVVEQLRDSTGRVVANRAAGSRGLDAFI